MKQEKRSFLHDSSVKYEKLHRFFFLFVQTAVETWILHSRIERKPLSFSSAVLHLHLHLWEMLMVFVGREEEKLFLFCSLRSLKSIQENRFRQRKRNVLNEDCALSTSRDTSFFSLSSRFWIRLNSSLWLQRQEASLFPTKEKLSQDCLSRLFKLVSTQGIAWTLLYHYQSLSPFQLDDEISLWSVAFDQTQSRKDLLNLDCFDQSRFQSRPDSLLWRRKKLIMSRTRTYKAERKFSSLFLENVVIMNVWLSSWLVSRDHPSSLTLIFLSFFPSTFTSDIDDPVVIVGESFLVFNFDPSRKNSSESRTKLVLPQKQVSPFLPSPFVPNVSEGNSLTLLRDFTRVAKTFKLDSPYKFLNKVQSKKSFTCLTLFNDLSSIQERFCEESSQSVPSHSRQWFRRLPRLMFSHKIEEIVCNTSNHSSIFINNRNSHSNNEDTLNCINITRWTLLYPSLNHILKRTTRIKYPITTPTTEETADSLHKSLSFPLVLLTSLTITGGSVTMMAKTTMTGTKFPKGKCWKDYSTVTKSPPSSMALSSSSVSFSSSFCWRRDASSWLSWFKEGS